MAINKTGVSAKMILDQLTGAGTQGQHIEEEDDM